MEKIKTIYCDFDGTITKQDMINTFFEKYADKKWIESEKLWIEGKISSRENAIIQVGMLPSISQQVLDDFINNFPITDGFKEFIEFIQKKGIKFVVLSDGFDLFIKKVLDRLGISDIEIYANHLIYENEKFSIEFPFYDENCEKKSGMCKCSKVKEKDFCYIGDGTSDLCVAQKAKILFATKNLMKYCKEKNVDFIPFNSFGDIVNYVKSSF